MKIENHYLDSVELLLTSPEAAVPPESWHIYSTVRSLVHDLLADLKDVEFRLRTYPEGHLSGLLIYCRRAAFHYSGSSESREELLALANECVTKIRSVLSSQPLA